ncbi:hypothetical protein GCM10022221_49620 [Actinocorallia aurea]
MRGRWPPECGASRIASRFDACIGDGYATMTTVDAEGRPRARVPIPVWELYRRTSPHGAGDDLGRFRTGIEDPKPRMLKPAPGACR